MRAALQAVIGRKLLAVVAVAALVAGGGAYALTGDNSGNHSVVLVNRHDGKAESKAGFSLKSVSGDVVDNANAAVAVSADCSGCRTVAVALQVVLVEGQASTIAPENYAIALNQNCTGCETMAAAYQYVVTTGGNVRFTAEGNQAMAEIEAEIRDVAASELSLPQIDASLDGLVDRYWTVVDEQLAEVGAQAGKVDNPKQEDVDIDTSDDAGPSASPSPSATESAQTGGTADGGAPTPCPSPIEAAEPTPSPTPSPTPTPTPTECPSPAGAGSEPAEPAPSATDEATPTPEESPTSTPTPTPSESSGG